MFKKFLSINSLVAAIFLLTTVFPPSLFSYEKAGGDSRFEKVDESLGYESVTFKKVRCPQCGMEFYYVPGKESPHSHWVQYEVSDKESSSVSSAPEGKGDATKEGEGLLGLFKQEKAMKTKIAETPSERELSFSQIEKKRFKEYELRQKLTCPYDGYDFFPEGDVIEGR